MRIFYVTNGIHIAGGQLANLEHVLGLRRLGYDASFLIVPPQGAPADFAPEFPPGREAPWRTDLSGLTGQDIVVVGEMFGAGALAVKDTPARKILHNQGPFYTFKSFVDLQALRNWGCESMIVPSVFALHMLIRMGWDRQVLLIRPGLDPVFAAAGDAGGPRYVRVATVASRRPEELRLIYGIFRSRRPDLAAIPWQDIRGVPRTEVARQMAGSEIFLSLGQLEGLGLPPLEAMATGALVVGFRGGGGHEYSSPENGDWFEDGQHFEIAEALIRLVDQLRAGERFEARRAAARETADQFSHEVFETQLAATWRALAGAPR